MDKCDHGEGHVISHRSMCIDLNVCWYVGTFIQVFKAIMFIQMDGIHQYAKFPKILGII